MCTLVTADLTVAHGQLGQGRVVQRWTWAEAPGEGQQDWGLHSRSLPHSFACPQPSILARAGARMGSTGLQLCDLVQGRVPANRKAPGWGLSILTHDSVTVGFLCVCVCVIFFFFNSFGKSPSSKTVPRGEELVPCLIQLQTSKVGPRRSFQRHCPSIWKHSPADY